MDMLIPAFDPFTAAGPADQIKARFRGTDRKGAKTSIAEAEMEDFDSLTKLIDTLPADDEMLNHEPPVKRTSQSRFSEEERNVRVHAWIYAIKYEADQDWHIIAGTKPSAPSQTYFNCEVSGLPTQSATSFDALFNVRKELAQILDNDLPSGSGYESYADNPIPVVVEGSLFYDIDHAPGVVGPSGRRPKTAWEVHPITNLELAQ